MQFADDKQTLQTESSNVLRNGRNTLIFLDACSLGVFRLMSLVNTCKTGFAGPCSRYKCHQAMQTAIAAGFIEKKDLIYYITDKGKKWTQDLRDRMNALNLSM